MDDEDLDFLFNKPTEKPVVRNSVGENQLLLPNGKLITFNHEQFTGINKMKSWLKSTDNTFTLAGGAGTGKSSILKKIFDDYHGGVVVSAPSHKAKRVVMNTTGKAGKTLQALLGLRPDVELSSFDPNFPIFNPIAAAQITDYNLVTIDEASMINMELYELIQEKIKGSRTKVLFVGDPCQIPPIGEKESVVFNQTGSEIHELTKIERQKDTNPLMLLYDDLRNNLNSVDGGFNRISSVNESGEGVVFTIDKRQFRKMVFDKFGSSDFSEDSDYAKLIAWKNDTVITSNMVIRQELFGKGIDIVVVNDILMGYRTVTTEDMRVNIIENSADYRVVEKSGLEENSYGISGYHVKLREDLDRSNKVKHQNVFIIDSNNHDNLHLYAQMHDFFRDMAKSNKRAWKKYYEFRRCNLLMKNIDKYKNGLYRSTGDVISKDIDYGYAITGHKSQGSTYSHSFVMENDIHQNWVVRERNQIFYVAMSRPSISATVLCNRLD